MHISPAALAVFKSFHPDDARIQALSYQEVRERARDVEIDWNRVNDGPAEPSARLGLSDCQMAVGYVVFDAVCLMIGAVGLRASVKANTIEAIAQAVGPITSQMSQILARLAGPNISKFDQAKALVELLLVIKNAGNLGAVISAFTGSLTWWTALLYSVTAIGTIVAALATEGLALAAEIALLLASFGFLGTDVYKCVQACSLTPVPDPDPEPTPPAPPFEFDPKGGLACWSNYALVVVNGGGLSGGDTAIQTGATSVGNFEKFTIIRPDNTSNRIQIKTFNGNFVTAVNGGGLSGPDDASCPVHTDSQNFAKWGQITMIQQVDGTFALGTQAGFYLTATGGGGWSDPSGTAPIRTDATVAGDNENFYWMPWQAD